jgi:alginate O-acetyltransferase complex protein AlgI
MRPFRSFLLLLIFLTCFTGLYYVIPLNIPLPVIEDFIPSFSTILPVSGDTVTVITEDTGSLQDAEVNHNAARTEQADTTFIPAADSIIPQPSFPQILSMHFDSLRKSGSQIRIMYYGDSQIEGDRITSYLRQTLREQYGGSGPGLLLPLMPVMYTRSVFVKTSSNWKRYNYLSYKNKETDTRSMGPLMAFCRYLPSGKVSSKIEEASVRIIPSQYADSLVSTYERLKLLYRNREGRVNIKISSAGKELLSDTLGRGDFTQQFICDLKNSRDVRITFSGKSSPDIFGISIESDTGLVVDNIPQRGSAGLEFTMVDKKNLQENLKFLAPDLFVLHYGLNIVRNVRKEYNFYEEGLCRQIRLLKEISPQTPVLVMSLTDMAYLQADSIRSFTNIPDIITAQRLAAEKSGAGFWDSRQAMGGEHSIILWAGKKSPLAQKDLVHFTYPGADTLSKLLVHSIFSWKDTSAKEPVAEMDTVAIPQKIVPLSDTIAVKAVENRGVLRTLATGLLSYDPGNPFIFTTPGFWLFLLVVLAGYSLVYRKLKLRNLYLLIISLYFYFKTGGLFLFLLIFVTVVDYTCAILINRAVTKPKKRFFLILSLASNLGLLAYFKYAAFITDSVNSLLGTQIQVFDILSSLSNAALGTSFDTSFIILPVGISFFTFQSLSYTMDVYRKRMEPVRNIIDFGFYVSFFPHLVAGPIVRASVFIPQVYQEYSLSKREFSHSLFMISKGLIKKIIISNFIALNFVDRVFDAPSIYSGFENLMAVYGYGLQIYCDFSGYTDIAIGVALILGFRLPINFNSPYKAVSITDFWRRWHISLSQWLKDYLYISLGGNRKGKIRTYFNLMITMLLGGLWHGASLRYIIWGGLHGLGLVADRIWSQIFKRAGKPGWIIKTAGIILTFHFVNFCWIFFRAESMDNASAMMKQIINSFSPGSWTTVLPAYFSVFLVILTGYLIHYLPERIKESYRGLFIRVPLPVQLAFIFVVGLLLFQMRTTEVMPFIYFRF